MSSFDETRNDSTSMLLSPPEAPNEHSTAAATPAPPAKSEMLPPTRLAIQRFSNRRAWLQFWRGLCIGVVTLVSGMFALALLDHFFRMSTGVRLATTLTVYATGIAVAWFAGIKSSRGRDWAAIARSMEAATPPLRERLLSAVELEDPRIANGSIAFRSSLQSGVAGQLSSVDIGRMLPWRLIRRSLFTAIGAGVLVALLSLVPGLQMSRRLGRVLVPVAPIQRASITQLAITAPTPPTRSVAEGDLIAVVVSVAKLGGGEVTLEWLSEDGRQGSQPMALRDFAPPARVLPDESRGDSHQGSREDVTASSSLLADADRELFSTNLQVDTAPVHYRVFAGDAESLWHTLSPMPRPQIVSFEKTYHFPAYAKLPDATEVENFGDLEALAGTRAEITVTFDQEVRTADVWFGGNRNSSAGVPMQEVAGDPTQFQFQVAIKTPGNFRVDAVSSQSELNNPFLPSYRIDPVFDREPLAAWSSELPDRQIASPAAILKLTGTVSDDLPMDRYLVQYSLGEAALRERVVSLSSGATEHSVEFVWDLMDLEGDGTEGEALPPGTKLRTRLVAIDRANQRGQSNWIQIYVGGEGFDPHRHDRLFEMQGFTTRLNSWWNDALALIEEIKTASEAAKMNPGSDAYSPDPALLQQLDELDSRWLQLAGSFDPESLRMQKMLRLMNEKRGIESSPLSLQRLISQSTDSVASDRWSLLDRFVTSRLDTLGDAVARWQLADELADTLPERGREAAASEVFDIVRHWEAPAKRARDLAPYLLASQLAAALLSDLDAVRAGANLLADEDSSVPIERLPGQADLLAERVRQIDDLIATLQPQLPDDSVRQLRNFRRFVSDSVHRLEQARETLQEDRNPNVEAEFRDSIAGLHDQMQRYHLSSLIQGNTFSKIITATRDFARDSQQNRATIDSLASAGRQWNTMIERSERAREKQDSAEIAAAGAMEKRSQNVFADRLSELSKQYQRSEERESIRPDSQIKTISDFKLVRQVAQHVTENGYVAIDDESPNQVFERIEQAAMILEAGGQVIRIEKQLQDMVDRERFGKNRADRAIGQNLRLEHYQVFSETPLKQLRRAEINNQVFDDLQDSRWDSDFSQARDLISRRRYDPAPFLSAAAPLQSIVSRYQVADATLKPAMRQARATLRAFLPSTSELAREAAKEARKQASPKDLEKPKKPEEAANDEAAQDDGGKDEAIKDEAIKDKASKDEPAKDDATQDKNGEDAPDESAPAKNDDTTNDQATPSNTATDEMAQEQSNLEQQVGAEDSSPTDQPSPSLTPQQQLDRLQEKVDRLAENLVDRANSADLSDAAERELARDADAALAQIQQEMEAVAAPLRETHENAKNSPQGVPQDSPPDVSEPLEQLAETLETTAEHFAAADAGEDLSPTREALRASGKADPAEAPTPDAVEAARQDAMATHDLAQATPEELLERLEEQLQRDQPMQESLSAIARRMLDDAQLAVQAAAEQEKRLQRELEKTDPKLSEQKHQLRNQLKALTDQARAIDENWMASAERASSRDQDQDAQDTLREMRQKLQAAAADAEQTQNDEALLQEIQSAAEKLKESLDATSEQTKAVQEHAERASQAEAHDSEKAREQRAKQLEAAERRTQNEWVKSLQRQEKDWKRRRDDAARRRQRAENQKRDAEKQSSKAEKQLQENPEQDWAQRNQQQSKQRVGEAARAVEAAKQTEEAAKQAQQRAAQKTEEAKKQSVVDLDANDPAAESLARLSQTSRTEMEQLSKQLNQLQQEAGRSDAPTPRVASAEQLAREQTQTRQSVENAAEDLQRAARHEQRLGKPGTAGELTQAAEELKDTLKTSMQQAQENLDQAAKIPEQEAVPSRGNETREQLANAAEQLAGSAKSLASLAEMQAPPAAASEPPPAAPEKTGTLAETDKSEKLARTLDQLDQALHTAPPAERDTQEQSAQAQGADGENAQRKDSQGEKGEGQNAEGKNAQGGKSASQTGEGEGPGQQQSTAGKASSTLAGAAEQALRRLAAQRQKQLSQIASAGQPQDSGPGQQSPSGQSGDAGSTEGSSSDQAGSAGSQSGNSSQMPNGGLLNLRGQERSGGDWGNLRERKSGDMIQDRKTRVPLNYRPAIEAYFQAIASEAARGGSGGAATENSP